MTEHDGWYVDVPSGVIGGPVDRLTNPELTTLAIYRGWVGNDAMFVAVSSRPRAEISLRREVRFLTRHFHDGAVDGDRVVVPGARDARRADGLMDIEEGYGDAPDWTERVTVVVVPRKDEIVVLTVRRHPTAPLNEVVEGVVSSFRLTAG